MEKEFVLKGKLPREQILPFDSRPMLTREKKIFDVIASLSVVSFPQETSSFELLAVNYIVNISLCNKNFCDEYSFVSFSADVVLLQHNVQHMVSFIEHIALDEDHSDSNISACCGLIG